MASISLTVEAKVLPKARTALSELVPAHLSSPSPIPLPRPLCQTRGPWLVLQPPVSFHLSTAHCSPSA